MKKIFFLITLLYVVAFSKAQTAPVVFKSPDANIVLTIAVENDKLRYKIAYNKLPVIEKSAMSIVVNGITFAENITAIKKSNNTKVNEAYNYRGVHSKAINKYNGGSVFTQGSIFSFVIETRVYNDGVAFRYIIDNKDSAIVEKDNTRFTIPSGSIIWAQPNIKYYEGKYTQKLIDTIKAGELMGPPVTIELPANAGYAVITEGGLTDFAGMSLVAKGQRVLQANLAGVIRKKGIVETPWRIIEIGKDLNTLVNCDIIANVSTAYDKEFFSEGYNTDWVKPGRSVWSWLAKTRSVTLENMKHFSDLAAELGFEYNLVDEGWSNWKDSINDKDAWDMMKELVDYSSTKGVKIWVWKAYPDRKGIPGIKDPVKRKEFFKKCKDLGIAGLKVDFFDNEAQDIIQFYQAALKDAAEYRLMMNFHGANKPTGETRTWPNEMTRESIRGMENRPPWAKGNTTLPFTRYLAGHADYTPIHFGDRMGEVSWAHHVASMIIFTSPFLCLGADPQTIVDNPCKEMIQSIPATWDETIVLPQSKIGELALFARRKGTTWFIAAMNGVHEPRTITLDLSFLKKGSFMFSQLKDDEAKQANVILLNSVVSSSSSLTIALNPEGGFAGKLQKK